MIEGLVDAGCFDFTGWSRDALRESIDAMFDTAAKEQADNAKGFMSLFAAAGEDANAGRFSKPPQVTRKTTKQEALFKEKTLLGFFLGGHPLEDYKQVLKRLSCVSLAEIQEMPHDAICRAAFLVEGVQVRTSSKSQKKFAILTISDGVENYELPIWPELYEEKSQLLRDNAVLFGVLQVDKKEESLRLSCKWMADLSQVNEALAEECDQAYDKAKHQVQRFAAMRSKPGYKEKGKMENEASSGGPAKNSTNAPSIPQKILVKINADILRISHIMTLKKIFSDHRGSIPVQIDFEGEGRIIASINIGIKWGIDFNANFEKALSELPPILSAHKSQ